MNNNECILKQEQQIVFLQSKGIQFKSFPFVSKHTFGIWYRLPEPVSYYTITKIINSYNFFVNFNLARKL